MKNKSYSRPRRSKKQRYTLGRFFRLLMIGINVIAALLLLFSYLSSVVSPRSIVYLAYPALIFPFLWVVHFLCLIYWMTIRSRWGWFALTIVVLSLPLFLVYFPCNVSPDSLKRKQVIKVLSYNVKMFNILEPHTVKHRNRIVDYIANSNADIVCVQEFAYSPRKKFLGKETILSQMREKGYKYIKITLFDKDHWHSYGLACFSKYPILSARKLNFHSSYNGSVVYEVEVKGRKLKVINNHLESNKLTTQDIKQYRSVIKNFEPEKANNVAGYMIGKLNQAYRLRSIQADSVASLIDQTDKSLPIVLCGDFNDTPLSYTYSQIASRLNDCYLGRGLGPGVTFNQRLFPFRIDYIMCSNHFEILNFSIDKLMESDHYPVWAELQIKN